MTIFDFDSSYSETDASNNSASPAGMPEGMAPSGVNDSWRAGMGAAKRAFDRDHAMSTTTVAGTANAITLAYSVAPAAYVQGQKFAFVATGTNTGATTVNVNSLGALNVYKKSAAGIVACSGGEIVTGDVVELEHDGSQFQIVGGAANAGFAETAGTIASAATVAIGGAAANYLSVTGTTTITAFDTVLAGTRRFLEFAGILTLTHDATKLILPGGANITTAAGDVAIMVSEGSGNWRCANYMRASGQPPAAATGAITKGTENSVSVATAKSSGVTSAAHGLTRAPDHVFLFLKCTTAELGFSIGDRTIGLNTSSAVSNYAAAWDATNTAILAQSGVNFAILRKDTGVAANITDASWSLVAVPVIFNGLTF